MTTTHEAAGALNEALYDGDYDPNERAALVGNHRAEVLREAVDRLSQVPFANVLTELRRMAGEAQQDGAAS
jgi:hypothetical protein